MIHAAHIWVSSIMFWTLYCFWTFLCMVLFPLPWAWLVRSGQTPDRAIRKLIWVYGRGSIGIIRLFSPIAAEDLSDGASATPVIIVANHASFFDMHCFSALPLDNLGTVVRSWPFKIPGFGFFMRRAGYLNTDELDHESLIDRSAAFLDGKASVVFFPEGTRTSDGSLGRFRTGAFHLAIRTGYPIVPVCIDGTGKFLRKGQWGIRPARIRVTALPPVDPREFQGRDAHLKLMKQIKSELSECLAAGGER